MTASKAVITGIGVISAAGGNLLETLDSFEKGLRKAGTVSLFPSPFSCPVFEVKTFPSKWGTKGTKGSRTLSLALGATEEALQNSGWADDLFNISDDLANLKVGVCLGTTVASQLNDLEFYKKLRVSKDAPMEPVDRFLQGNLAQAIAHILKVRGPSVTVVNACSSGTDAIGIGLSWLRGGLCDLVLAGGADELNRVPLSGFASLGIVSDSLCAPFDRDRAGLNLGEGAGILVLETEETAQRRGKETALYVAGYGTAADGYHLTAPHPEGIGLKAALQRALSEADISPQQVSFINAHGTATLDNDRVEGNVLANLFGSNLKVLSTKGFTGHTLGAAGGLEAAFTAAALLYGWIPASPGFVTQDEQIPIRPVMEKTSIHGSLAVSTSLAFGGNNSALIIGRYTGRGHKLSFVAL